MDYKINIKSATVKTKYRLHIEGYVLWEGKTPSDCSFDYTCVDIENENIPISFSKSERKRLIETLKNKFGVGKFVQKVVNEKVNAECQIEFISD